MVVEEEFEDTEEEEVKTKDLVRFLGMKDGVTASMASQGRMSDDLGTRSSIIPGLLPKSKVQPHASSVTSTAAASESRTSSIGSTPLERIIHKQSSTESHSKKTSS